MPRRYRRGHANVARPGRPVWRETDVGVTAPAEIPLRRRGVDRPYLLLAPAALVARAPLVVELHGRGIDPVRFDALTGFGALAAEAGFALVLPRAVGGLWNDGRMPNRTVDDVGYLAAVIDHVCARLPIERRRVYLVGMSNGATMAARFVCESADRITAFAQVAGTAAVSVGEAARPAGPVPLLHIDASADEFAPYEGGSRRNTLRARLVLRRPAGPSVGVDDWARFWAERNRAVDGPEIRELPPDTTVRTWRDAGSSPVVVFYRVAGAGHTWPGSRVRPPRALFGRTTATFEATRAIWAFFEQHD